MRIAVNTGEALVTLDARPTEGEGMAAGDVVNTAARLQTAAPVERHPRRRDDVPGDRARDRVPRGATPVEAKGKAEPVAVWEALAGAGALRRRRAAARRARRSSAASGSSASLRDALDRVREERSPQLVTLVGVPGIGKSRLVYELSQIVDAEPELISWRQGRSLPYGEGVSFWALGGDGEGAGGHPRDRRRRGGRGEARAGGRRTPSSRPTRDWVRRAPRRARRPRPTATLGGDRRGEAFAAWRRFFEALAEQRPLVLVFEDLHWADDGLLDFVDHLVDWATGVPILVVGTARPELLERRPGWGGGKANAHHALALAALGRRHGAPRRRAARAARCSPAEAQADAARARRRQPALRRGVRADARRARRRRRSCRCPRRCRGSSRARLDALVRRTRRGCSRTRP